MCVHVLQLTLQVLPRVHNSEYTVYIRSAVLKSRRNCDFVKQFVASIMWMDEMKWLEIDSHSRKLKASSKL